MAVLAIAATVLAFNGAQRIPDWLLSGTAYYDVWFDGDSPRHLLHMTDRLSDQRDRSFMHPLFSYSYYVVLAIRSALLVSPYTAARIFMALGAGLWVSLLFLMFRRMGCRQLDAGLLALAGMVSAASLFWFSVMESWGFGSITTVVAFLTALASERRDLPVRRYLLANVATLSVSVTNWSAGLLLTFLRFSWRRAVWIALSAFGTVALICTVNPLIFPTFKLTFPQYAHEYVFQPESGGALHILSAFLYHGMVMPLFRVVSGWDHPGVVRMTVQQMLPGSASVWGIAGVVCWTLLLALGAWTACRLKALRRFRLLVGFFLTAELILHLVYGAEEVFLYSLHWLPALLVVVACSALTRWRYLTRGLLAVLVVCAAVNNWRQFNNAVLFANNPEAVHDRLGPKPPAPVDSGRSSRKRRPTPRAVPSAHASSLIR